MATVTFVPQCVAEKICGEFGFTISIMPPGELANINGDYGRLHFDDTETPCPGLVMFDTTMASKAIGWAEINVDDGGSLLVHCEAGISRSAAVAQWLADNMGYELVMHPDGIGTTQFYNRHVYRTLDAANGNNMAAWYAEQEMKYRMMT
ncbi:dual specificity protein phosphatase-like protein [Kushneria sinocarnis]|uniref:Dual specificity protein phosphatase-like protein n=1 Tax=Kushneria sinocarnis TaxID=595502 RepID=A0A420WUH3_9GAMM|nr:dual specificity protein phosphatase family protein [Kushneria sinocarnis]RKQ97097.1 dual specificity protein phosphatase-like protein [Kushneria sinocarnis]